MKYLMIISLLLLKCSVIFSQNKISSSVKSDSILIKVYERLNSIKNIKYDNLRELNYSSENYHKVSRWTIYYDFEMADSIVGAKYQIEDSAYKQFFNGTEKFDLDKKAKTMQIIDNPSKKQFTSLSAFYNSIFTLKNILPVLIKDKAATKILKDTIINNNTYSLVTINVGKRRIQNLGYDFDVMTTKRNFIYKIIVQNDSNLPFEILQNNDIDNDFIKTSFYNIEVNTHMPSEISWYYSTYSNHYKIQGDVATSQLLTYGSLSPEWSLETFNKDKSISLSDLKGKVILLDFWIKNCGPCIQSVPHLNELKKKYKSKDVEIISINSYDSKEDVNWFYKKYKIDYTVLLNGKGVAAKYGVNAFPTFFIIDKTGKIIYSKAGFNESVQAEVEKVIKQVL